MNHADRYLELSGKLSALTEIVNDLHDHIRKIEKDIDVLFRRDGIEGRKCTCGHQSIRWVDSGCAVYPPTRMYVCDMYPYCYPINIEKSIAKQIPDIHPETDYDVSTLFI
jgi:hypothetical protein